MASRNNKPARIVKGTAKQPTLKEASGIWTLDEALQAHRANSWPQPNLLQPIPKSLRFKNNSSFVTKQTTRPGNQRTWTVSLWVKRDTLGTRDGIFTDCNVSGNSYWGIEFGADNTIAIYASGVADLITTQVFRDTTAWYHIVVSVDTLQSTSSNRTKLYVNGVQVTSFSSAGYPTQGLATRMNGTVVPDMSVGSWYPSPGAFHFDGYISEVNFIDGYQVDPSMFGQAGTDGIWIPKEYTGSHGTNGFYLPFTTTADSRTVGYDYSNFSTYDADQDPYRGNVALHLTGNGPAGGNNNSFFDTSSNNFTISRYGTITQGSFSPFPFDASVPYNPVTHGASAYFDGDGDYLRYTGTALGSGNFTIELWSHPLELRSNAPYFDTNSGLMFRQDTANILVYDRTNATSWSTTGDRCTLNAWNHIAVVRSSGTITVYVNGISAGSSANSTNFTNTDYYIGGFVNTQATPNAYYGYLSGLRVTVGTAIYTAAFTPTNKPFGTLTNNLLNFSENFTSAWWASNTSNTEGTAIAPNGTPSATTLVAGTYPVIAGVGSSTVAVTGSIYAKANVGNQLTFRLNRWGSGADYVEIIFNLTTGTATGATTAGTASGLATSIVNVGNGWWRCIISGTTSTTAGAISFNPNPTNGSIFIWGAQLETGGTATNYTPTPANFSTAPSLLLNFANAAVVDSTGASNVVTVGNATISSSSKYGSGALLFNNSGVNNDYLNITNLNCTLAGNFTVEFWYRPQSTSTSYTDYAAILDTDAGAGSGIEWWVIHQVNQTLYWATAGGAADLTTGNVFTVANEWYHVAFVRNNQKLSFYINGKEAASRSYTTTFGSVRQLRVGAQGGGSRGVRASIDDLRITKDIARYQADFTPPSRALPETGGKSFVTRNVTVGTVRSFTTTGTTSWKAPYDVTSVEVLVVAGGGGGGADRGSGGGGGGLIYNSAYPVTPGQTYTVTVGAGGAGGVGASAGYLQGSNGGNSVFGALTAIGGGGGGAGNGTGSNSALHYGLTGGSGGGSTGSNGQVYPGAAGTAGQGFSGGYNTTISASLWPGGGGGGAGGTGTVFSSSGTNTGSTGGPGLYFGISGSNTAYAGGGGGGPHGAGSDAAGGVGGGGTGKNSPEAGAANTGGGGGGSGNSSGAVNGSTLGGANGGSGIVIVRYTTAAEASHWSEDSLVDSPTSYGHDLQLGGEVVGNYATLNPLNVSSTYVNLYDGNLTYLDTTAPGSYQGAVTNIFANSGKWYAEFTIGAVSGGSNNAAVGIASPPKTLNFYPETTATGYAGYTYASSGSTQYNDTYPAFGATYATGDVISVAVDIDNLKVWFAKNGVWQASGDPAGGGNPAYTIQSGLSYGFACNNGASASQVYIYCNFGQRPWVYKAPQGFNALTTKNLPIPTGAAANPNQYFDTVLYTGTSSNVTVSNLNFQPDLIWVKARSNAQGHSLIDSVRGTSKLLQSNTTGAELTLTNLPTFNANGFTSTTDVHTNAYTYVAWCWKANGAAVSNTDGSITSQVSANTTSGFSIVSYTGTAASTVTIGHGLGVSPSFIILKNRDTVGNWYCYHSALGPTYRSSLNLTDTPFSPTGLWNSTAPSSTVFSTVQDGISFNNGSNHIAYCWSEVPGFSKFGSYTGNGSTDGPFVYLGFKPRYVLVKGVSNATDWNIIDTARDGVANTASNKDLITNATNAEASYGDFIWDFTSNGFKIRQISSAYNTASNSYIYAAFAENPFKTGRAR